MESSRGVGVGAGVYFFIFGGVGAGVYLVISKHPDLEPESQSILYQRLRSPGLSKYMIDYLETITKKQEKEGTQCQKADLKATIHYASFFAVTVCNKWKLHAPNV